MTSHPCSGGGRAVPESVSSQKGGGEMDMREYVVALSVVCRPSQTLDTIRLAFKVSVAFTRPVSCGVGETWVT